MDQNNTVLGRRGTRSVIKFVCAHIRRWSALRTYWPNGSPFEEMQVLQGVSVLTSVWAREWQYKDILNDIDGLMWEALAEDLRKYLSEAGESPAL